MKPAYYLSVLIIAGVAIGTIVAVRSHARSKKIHRVLSYEETTQKTEELTEQTIKSAAQESDKNSSNNFEITDEEVKDNSLPEALKNLTATDLRKSHSKQFVNRIRPRDYIFTSVKMESYLTSLAENTKAQAREKRRIKILETLKPTLIAFLSKNAYEGKISLNNSQVTPNGASIAMANDHVLIMHSADGTKELKWSDISAATVASMIQNMARIREKSDLAYKQSQTAHNIQVADDYLLAAVFCDWYGNYTGATRLIKKAVIMNPQLADFAKNLFTD